MSTRYLLVGVCSVFLFVSGCKKDENNPAGSGQPTVITVVGFVKDSQGEPMSGIAVIIIGKAAVTTGTDGSFTVAEVSTPYDIVVVQSTQKTATMYKGLTRSDPTLVFTSFSVGTPKSATISGTVPAAVGKITRVYFVSGTMTFSTTANATTGAYTINAGWTTSATSFVGKVRVLRYTNVATGFPTEYDAAGEKDQTITAGGTFSNVNFAAGELTDPTEQTIAGTTTRAATTYTLGTRSLYINFGNSILFLTSQAGASPYSDDFNITVPAVTGATFGIYSGASQPATVGTRTSFLYRAGIAPGTTGLTINLAAAPQLTAPVNNGTNVDTTTSFLFSAGGATGVHQVSISPSVGTNPRFVILTTGTTVTIPNLVSLGLGLPPSAGYSWSVTQYSPIATMNDAASGNFFALITGTGGNVGFGFSEAFSFTTKP